MEKKFTKGPWKVINGTCPDAPPRIYSESPNKQAEIYISTIGEWPRNKEDKANARLIAAAPEMFELLEEFISIYNNGGWGLETLHFQAQELITRITKQP